MMRLVLSAGVIAAMVGAAEAAPKCSPGKIYRVSKKVCVDKIAAVRDGVMSARQTQLKAIASNRSRKLSALQVSRQAPLERFTAAAREDTSRNTSAETSQSVEKNRTIILSPVRNVIGSPTSPFGALHDPWRSDSFSALQETRFSLRTTTEN